MTMRHIRNRRTSQTGNSAIEFAFVFPLLFGVTYAAVVYGYVFYAQQTLNFIGQEAARDLVRVEPSAADNSALLNSTVQTMVAQSASQLPLIGRASVTATVTASTDGANNPTRIINVQMPMTAITDGGGFASIPLPFLGTFPPLPTILSASTVVRVN